jgi:hypothetical protein
MKKLVFIITALAFVAISAAQNTTFGVKGGLLPPM